MIKDYLNIAVKSITRRKMRSWLTLLGIFIGIAAVVALISLGQGMKQSITGELEKIGGDKIFIQPKTILGSMGEGTTDNPLTTKDMEFVENLAGVDSVAMYVMTSAKVTYQDVVRYYVVLGVSTEPDRLKLLNEFFAYNPIEGRVLESGDKYSLVAGYHHGFKGLYDGKNVNVNSKILLNEQKFNIVGIYEPVGSPSDDQLLQIPENTFRELFDIPERVDTIVIKVSQEKDLNKVADEVERSLARYRGVKEGKEDFSVQTPQDIMESFDTILNVVQAVLIGIALISLFVGSIGIMNTMYTSVLERNKDIGVMKAIGAKNRDIFTLFFIESGMLGIAGGIIGVVIGVGLAKSVEIISTQALGKSFLQAYFSTELIVGVMLFSFIVGAAAGTLPALQASKLQPVETLREE